jgi:hypothetical protein
VDDYSHFTWVFFL